MKARFFRARKFAPIEIPDADIERWANEYTENIRVGRLASLGQINKGREERGLKPFTGDEKIDWWMEDALGYYLQQDYHSVSRRYKGYDKDEDTGETYEKTIEETPMFTLRFLKRGINGRLPHEYLVIINLGEEGYQEYIFADGLVEAMEVLDHFAGILARLRPFEEQDRDPSTRYVPTAEEETLDALKEIRDALYVVTGYNTRTGKRTQWVGISEVIEKGIMYLTDHTPAAPSGMEFETEWAIRETRDETKRIADLLERFIGAIERLGGKKQ